MFYSGLMILYPHGKDSPCHDVNPSVLVQRLPVIHARWSHSWTFAIASCWHDLRLWISSFLYHCMKRSSGIAWRRCDLPYYPTLDQIEPQLWPTHGATTSQLPWSLFLNRDNWIIISTSNNGLRKFSRLTLNLTNTLVGVSRLPRPHTTHTYSGGKLKGEADDQYRSMRSLHT